MACLPNTLWVTFPSGPKRRLVAFRFSRRARARPPPPPPFSSSSSSRLAAFARKITATFAANAASVTVSMGTIRFDFATLSRNGSSSNPNPLTTSTAFFRASADRAKPAAPRFEALSRMPAHTAASIAVSTADAGAASIMRAASIVPPPSSGTRTEWPASSAHAGSSRTAAAAQTSMKTRRSRPSRYAPHMTSRQPMTSGKRSNAITRKSISSSVKPNARRE
ncbi:hypothetical protein [Paenibacillus sp. UNC496MF]|uniref:hypothetical protein n=1 Tax=Paenibacillus sp. UNC496MF TaxID=1502753 RepID=UPI00116048D6|nr:hypothetical protein [Paenibacillus sp. UNC496MF]